MKKAVIFDCDGLLINTETVQYDVFCEIYASYGLDLPLETYVQCVGSSFADFDPYGNLISNANETIDLEELKETVHVRFTEVMEQEQLRSGVIDYLQTAKEHGLKIGLASSSSREWVVAHLERFDILKYFDCIHTKDDVEKVKPNPELYTKTLEVLGVKAEEAIIFEDSLNGLRAAKAAGANCVVVPNKVTEKLPFENYDMKLSPMSDISLIELIKKIEEEGQWGQVPRPLL